jgi:hypothetical protein
LVLLKVLKIMAYFVKYEKIGVSYGHIEKYSKKIEKIKKLKKLKNLKIRL